MNEKLKLILDEQISNAVFNIPTVGDIVDGHTFLFTVKLGTISSIESLTNNPWEKSFRLKHMLPYILEAIRDSGVMNLKFFIYTADATWDCDLDDRFPVLSFCKLSGQNAITIPNVDFYSGSLESSLHRVSTKDVSYTNKTNSSFFAGSSTNRKRMEYCEKMLTSDKHEAVITNVVGQVDRNEWPNFESYVQPRWVSLSEQMKHKFLVNIDGYAACYSRLYWQMASNSIPVYLIRDTQYEQLHDYLIEPDEHYIHTDFDRWPVVFEDLDEATCKHVVTKGKEFCNEHFTDINKKTVDILSYTFRKMEEAS